MNITKSNYSFWNLLKAGMPKGKFEIDLPSENVFLDEARTTNSEKSIVTIYNFLKKIA